MLKQACQPLAIAIAATRPGLLSPGSYVAPSPQRRIVCKRHETELTYCPVYGFKPRVICTKGLTSAIFYWPAPNTLPGRSNKKACLSKQAFLW